MDTISQEVQEQILNKKCPIHGENSSLLYIGNKSSSRRICIRCAQLNIPSDQIVDIQDILNFNPSSSSPIFESHQKISFELIEMLKQENQMISTIEHFLLKFQKDIEEQIAKIKEKTKLLLDSFSKINQESNNPGQQISKVEHIQKILIGKKSNEDQELEQCISEWNKEKESDINLDKVKEMQSNFSISSAEKVALHILQLIGLINFFSNDSKQNIEQQNNAPFQAHLGQHHQPQLFPFENIQSFQAQPSQQTQQPFYNRLPQSVPYSNNLQQYQQQQIQYPLSSQQLQVQHNMNQNPQPTSFMGNQSNLSQPQQQQYQQNIPLDYNQVFQSQNNMNQDIKFEVGTNLLSKIQFLPSEQFKESSKMNFQFKINSTSVVIFNTSNRLQQCYLNTVLQKKSNYLIQLTYNHLSQEQFPSFSIGLIQQSLQNAQLMGESDNIYYHQRSGGKINKMIKGVNMKSGDSFAIGQHQFEIHINIEQKLFRVCSMDYLNCQELDYQNYFSDKKLYYLAICLSSNKDSVVVRTIKEVLQFPNLKK